MYEITFDDVTTPTQRVGGYVTRSQKIRKFYGAVIILIASLWILTAVANHLVDRSIKSVQLKNLTLYHDVNGFKPVHNSHR